MKKINSFIIVAVLMISYPLIDISKQKKDTCQQQYHKILVLAINDSQDKALAGNMEKNLADNLNKLGYTAVSATSQYGYNAFKSIREEETIKQLYPYDAVITLTLLSRIKENCWRPVSDSNTFFWNYYADMYSHVNTPGYYTEKGKYYWQANLYELNKWQVKYSMQTQSFEPTLKQYTIPDYAKLIVNDMIKNEVFQKKEKNLKPF